MARIRGFTAFFLCALPYALALTTRSSSSDDSILLDAEKTVLLDDEVTDYPDFAFGDYSDALERRGRTCKVIPGDAQWPSLSSWALLDTLAGGRLLKPAPIGDACYPGPQQDLARCDVVKASWTDSDLQCSRPPQLDHEPLYQGLVCLPNDNATSTCKQGGYPIYVLDAANTRDIQLGLNFARNKNIRLVIKNTGHDFAGKSSGSFSLSIRTHNIQGVKHIPNYGRDEYDGPAFRIGAGVLGRDLYAESKKHGLVVVGGEAMTVGWGGGYIQGGGHSPLSSIYGMAADHVLSFEVVLPSGRLITADATQNTDVFWALRGGGGSTYGVVVSTTVKAFPTLPVSVSSFAFFPSARDVPYVNDDFWSVVRTYFSLFPAHADEGIYSYFMVFPMAEGSIMFLMQPFFAPNKTAAELTSLLQPVLDKAAEVGIYIAPTTSEHDNFYDAWQVGFPKEVVGGYSAQPSSRLFPRENFVDPSKFDATFQAVRNQVSRNDTMGLIAFNIAPTLAAGGYPDNAVNPHWRNTVFHAISHVVWDESERDLEKIRGIMENFSKNTMQPWRDVSPGAGSYLNEGDINEPEWQESFYGDKYDRLYEIKQKVDPWGLFYAPTAVGSENWSAGVSRLERLCPV